MLAARRACGEVYLTVYTVLREEFVAKPESYRGVANVFWSGRSQAVRLPAACRFETFEVEVIKEGDQVTLRPRGKNWRAYFDRDSRGSLPERQQPPLEERDQIH